MGLGWLLVAVAVGLVMDLSYADRALPGFHLASQDISGIPVDEVDSAIDQLKASMTIDFQVGDEAKTATAADLGVTINRNAVADAVANASSRPFWVYRTTQLTTIPVSLSIDQNQFNAWLYDSFPDDFIQPLDAEVWFNATTHKYELSESADGTGVGQADLESLEEQLSTEGSGALELTPIPKEPLISSEEAAPTLDWVNDRLQTQCSLIFNGKVVYTLKAEDIAAMATIDSTAERGMMARFDLERVMEFVEQTLTPLLNTRPTTRVVIIDPQGKVLRVFQEGVVGRSLQHGELLPPKIAQCLTSGQSTQIEASFIETPFTVEETVQTAPSPPTGAENSHWADVNLSTQMVTLMNGKSAETTFVISSGGPGFETPTGVFAVYAKTTIQPLSGCENGECWYFPDVRWLTWFYRDFGFHTAYWHEDFGTPRSHGCINMKENEAKQVFDWLVRGDKVYIHY